MCYLFFENRSSVKTKCWQYPLFKFYKQKIIPHDSIMYCPLLAYFRRKHELVFGALAIQWTCADFLWPKCDNFAHLYRKLRGLPFFQNLYTIFALILHHHHDFQSIVTIFPSVIQMFDQPCLGGA